MHYLLLIFLSAISLTSFAQTENFWTAKSDFAGLERERAIAFTVGDYAYVGTGVDSLEVLHNDLWKYDPVLDAWTQVASLPGSVRRNAIAFSIGNFGYVGTGMNGAIATDVGSITLNDLWQYNPATNGWTQKANFPGNGGIGIYFSTAFTIDSKGYVCGGKMGSNFYSNQLWEYKPTIDQWTQLPNFPGGVRYQLASFSIGYKAYVGFGTDQDFYRKDIWEFDATTNQWTEKSDFPGSERASLMTFSLGQRGFVCMGSNGGMLDDLWEYNPFSDGWSVRATYGGSPRKNAVAFTLDGKAYVGTGKGFSGKKASFHMYTPYSVLGNDELDLEFSVYPNPCNDYVHLSYDESQIDQIELYSIIGRKVFSGDHAISINVESFDAGAYVLIAKRNSVIVSKQQLIIQ